MPSFFDKFKSRVELLYQSDDENDSLKYAKGGQYEPSRVRTGKVRQTVYPAACRGMYGAAAKQKCMESCTTEVKHLTRVREDDDPNDPIVRHSMYPQMIGKRRSELEAEVRTRRTKYDRALTEGDSHEHVPRTGRPVRRQQPARRVRRPRSVKSGFSSDSDSDSDSDADYSSGENSEGRPVRVCIYPQAKYIKEPVTMPFDSQQGLAGYESSSAIETHTQGTSSYHNWKRDRLPYDEYQILRRRQVMQRAREVLEPHYFHHGAKRKKGLVGHGETQCFTEYHTERRRISRIQYAVRKAMQADLSPFSDTFDYAMTRHAQKERFCELSDVDGAPITEKLMWDFIQMYRKTRDKAYELKEPKLPMVRPGEDAQCTSNNERNNQTQQDTLHRVDSGATIRVPAQGPALISEFDWDSSDDEGFTKIKRKGNGNMTR